MENQLRSKNDGNDKVFLLGGGATYWTKGDPHAHVEAYDETGHLGSFPDLLQPRWVGRKLKFDDRAPEGLSTRAPTTRTTVVT